MSGHRGSKKRLKGRRGNAGACAEAFKGEFLRFLSSSAAGKSEWIRSWQSRTASVLVFTNGSVGAGFIHSATLSAAATAPRLRTAASVSGSVAAFYCKV